MITLFIFMTIGIVVLAFVCAILGAFWFVAVDVAIFILIIYAIVKFCKRPKN